jgi:large subunit ribosomal protein L10
MNKGEKRQKAEALHQELEKSRTVILAGFEGITVAQDFELRRRIAQVGAKYKVVKNSLIERASQGTPVEPAARELSGTTSLAYTQEDPVALAKVLTAYAKENPLIKFKSGVVEGRVVSMADLSIVANLPAKEELLSRALFLINSPARRLAWTLSGVARNIVFVIQEAVREHRFDGVGKDESSPATQSAAYVRLKEIIDYTFNPVQPDLREQKVRAFLENLRNASLRIRDFRVAVHELQDGAASDLHDTPPAQTLMERISGMEYDALLKYYLGEVDRAEKDFQGLKAEFAREFAS